jgi:hypothetical protein
MYFYNFFVYFLIKKTKCNFFEHTLSNFSEQSILIKNLPDTVKLLLLLAIFKSVVNYPLSIQLRQNVFDSTNDLKKSSRIIDFFYKRRIIQIIS